MIAIWSSVLICRIRFCGIFGDRGKLKIKPKVFSAEIMRQREQPRDRYPISPSSCWTTAVIMILLEVGNSSVTNALYRLLTLHAAYIAFQRRYPNHPRGEMHQVSSSRFPNAKRPRF